ncbi:MAG: ATP-binding protein [Carbonactinosporaceae bacterium]
MSDPTSSLLSGWRHVPCRDEVERAAVDLQLALRHAGVHRIARLVTVNVSALGRPRVDLVPLRLHEVRELISALQRPQRPRRQEQLIAEIQLPGHAVASSAARHCTAALLGGWGATFRDAELIVSELVTNAVHHGDVDAVRTLRLMLWREDNALRVEVHDHSPGHPEPREPHLTDPRGRGLVLVRALSREWGSYLSAGGKVVWCVLEQAWPTSAPQQRRDADPRGLK